MFSYRNNRLEPKMVLRTRHTDNNSTILFTNARDEPNLAEWIAHHILLGFDKVIVFDHKSLIPINSQIKTNFDNKLEIIRVDGSGNIKINMMQKAVDIATNRGFSWMLYLDADEFLNLNKHLNVKEFLDNFKEADSIGINWLMFGTSGHIEQPKGLLTSNFIRSEIRLNINVKTFVRPSVVARIINPHYYVITNPNRCYDSNGLRMKMGPFNIRLLPFIKAKAYIAHYYTQSEVEHRRRKSRMMDDGSTNKNEMIKEIHNSYNNVTNNQLQNKYAERIKQFLNSYGINL